MTEILVTSSSPITPGSSDINETVIATSLHLTSAVMGLDQGSLFRSFSGTCMLGIFDRWPALRACVGRVIK